MAEFREDLFEFSDLRAHDELAVIKHSGYAGFNCATQGLTLRLKVEHLYMFVSLLTLMHA
ncbi:MAG: hypothetical protein WD942_01185 [Dehalococcoidia bacterium]